MVKYHSERERERERERVPLPPLHGLLFFISSKGSFIRTIPQIGQHGTLPLLHLSWSTGWNEKYLPKLRHYHRDISCSQNVLENSTLTIFATDKTTTTNNNNINNINYYCCCYCYLYYSYCRYHSLSTNTAPGQVMSECLTCTFRASCCSARLSRAQVPAFANSSVRDRKNVGEGVSENRLHWRVQGSTSSPTGIGSKRRVV